MNTPNSRYKNFIRLKKLQGWKQLGVILPPDVFVKVLTLKNTLMEEYKQSYETLTTHIK